jgi:hypothetical protein
MGRLIDADELLKHKTVFYNCFDGDSNEGIPIKDVINAPTVEINNSSIQQSQKTNLDSLIEKLHKSDTAEYIYMLIKRISGGYPCGCCVYQIDCLYDGRQQSKCTSGVFKWFKQIEEKDNE